MSIGARRLAVRAVGFACALAAAASPAHARELRAGTLHLAGASSFSYGRSTTKTDFGEGTLVVRSLVVDADLAAAVYLSRWFGVGPEVAFATQQVQGADPSYALFSAGLRAELDHALSDEVSVFGSASARLGMAWINQQTPRSRSWKLAAGVKAFVGDAWSLDLGVSRAGASSRSGDHQASTAEWRLGIGVSLYVDLAPAAGP